MRLGELKQNLDYVINESNKTINIKAQQKYGGNAYEIKDYNKLMRVLNIISENAFSKYIPENTKNQFLSLNETTNITSNNYIITLDDYNKLNNYISQVNSKLPVFYAILEEMCSEQNFYTINIKIPDDNIKSLTNLNNFNKDLEEVFKLIIKHKGLSSDYKFLGFDIGSSWYEILITGGPLVYSAFMGVLSIAKKLIILKKQWHECDTVKYQVEMLKEDLKDKKETNKIKEEFINKLLEKKKQEELQELIKTLPDSSNNETETEASLTKGIDKLISLLEKGTEIHPSLNPPKFIEVDGVNKEQLDFNINYEELQKLIKEEAKQLEHKKEDEEEILAEEVAE